MRAVFVSILAITTLVLSAASYAAELSSFVSKEGKAVLKLDGELTEGDSDRVASLIRSENQAGRLVSGIRLNSGGGSIAEGAKLADVVRNGKIATVVTAGSTCASACFIAFAGGNEKYASYTAQIGVHGASDASGQETTSARAATVLMARIVKELGVPERIIGKMVVTPPSQMVWLAPDELRSMGTTLTGKPNQTAQPSPLPQSGPTQLGPQASTPPQSEAPLSWKAIVDAGIARSKEQNGGTPRFSRGCQPELKSCFLVLIFKNKSGNDVIVRTTEDSNGKILKRDICTFNSFGDIRECSDFDTGATTKEMQGTDKQWRRID